MISKRRAPTRPRPPPWASVEVTSRETPALSAPRLLFALTSHGLGHLTRSLALARELRERVPDLALDIATTVPEERVAVDLAPPFGYRPVAYEPGTPQRNAFELDLPALREAYARLAAEHDARLEEELSWLRHSGCCAVVSDIPALPVRAAARLGLPAIGVANFTWDWILEPLLAGTDAAPALDLLREDYACGDLHLLLPFGPASSPFPECEPAPLIHRRATLAPEAVRAGLGLPARDERKLVLVCPGGWDPDGWGAIDVSGCEGMRFVTVGDLPVRAEAPLLALPHALAPGLRFPDLVAAADLVLAKPGYGIASECAAHRTALVSIERPLFREAPLLVSAFARLGPGAQMTLADFFAGRWEPALRSAIACAMPWSPPPADAAGQVARRVAERLGLAGEAR